MPKRWHVIGLLALGLAFAALKVAFVAPPRPLTKHQVHGAYHVHSNLSDGRASPDAICAAAAARGLDFLVLTDHNRLDPKLGGLHHGVLLVPATEESANEGHIVSLGAKRALDDAEKRGDALQAIRKLGGTPMLAHPYNRRMPFSDWPNVGEAAGLEALSYDDLWREALHAPFGHGLVIGALESPFNKDLAVSQLVRRPDQALAGFDALRVEHPLSLVCADDAHGLPSYRSVLGLMSMYLDISEFEGADPQLVLRALAAGRGYCGLDAIAPASGFSFRAEAPQAYGGTMGEGMSGPARERTVVAELPATAPRAAELHLFQNGREVLVSRGPRLVLPRADPGDYRVEVWAPLPGAFWDGPMVPWILSNPIRLK